MPKRRSTKKTALRRSKTTKRGYRAWRLGLSLFLLTVAVSLALAGKEVWAQVWSEPTAAPPGDNAPAPIWNIDVSGTAQAGGFNIAGSGRVESTLFVNSNPASGGCSGVGLCVWETTTNGIFSRSDSGVGVYGYSVSGNGIYGINESASSPAMYGVASSTAATAIGVMGASANGYGGWFSGKLNATGEITQNGVKVCLADGTNCPSLGGGGAWALRDLPANFYVNTGSHNSCFINANGQFLSVGSGSYLIYSSPDGTTWTSHPAAPQACIGVTYGNGLYVAVGSAGTGVMTSPDGYTWTTRTAAVAKAWSGVTYGNGLFVAVSSDNPGYIMTSSNGIDWTSRGNKGAYSWYKIMYGNGYYLALGTYPATGGFYEMYSTDGINWSIYNPGYGSTPIVVFAKDLFIAAYPSTPLGVVIRTFSIPGSGGTTAFAGRLSSHISDFAYGNETFVGVGSYGSPAVNSYVANTAITSTDAHIWSEEAIPYENIDWVAVAYGNSKFVAIGTGVMMVRE